MFKFYTNILLVLFTFVFFSQASAADFIEITGRIVDKETQEPLAGVNIQIKGTISGTVTDIEGNFKLKTNQKPPFILVVNVVGYKSQEYDIKEGQSSLIITLENESLLSDEVVVTASRVEESVLKSPVSIEKLDIRAIKESAAPSFYDAIENMKGVQMTTASLTFKIPNTRGFNVPNNFRFMQLVDGVDNQAATLGVPLGNAIGPTELDIESVEITPGAASALYGMNAINGMSNLLTKSPFKYQGLSVFQKTGVNHVSDNDHNPAVLTETSIRYAKAFNDRFAFKINASYMQGVDWYASNPNLLDVNNFASNDNTNINPNFPNLSGPGGIAADPVNSYGNESGNKVNITDIAGKTYSVRRSGYFEKDLVDYKVQNKKVDASIHYRINEKVELSYGYRIGEMDGNFQRGNRIALRGTTVQNHKVELKGSNFLLRGYVAIENTGNSYNLKPLADNLELGFKSNSQWANDYTAKLNSDILNGISSVQAHQDARAAADNGREAYKAQYINEVKTTNNWDIAANVPGAPIHGGAALYQKSKFYHAEGQYDLSDKIKFVDLLIGGDYRVYAIQPDGNNFVDYSRPVADRNQPLANGSYGNDQYYTKFGFFGQATKRLFDDKLKLVASLRYDKNLEFKHKLNPRIAAVYTLAEKHNFRISYQNGFRFPSLFEALSFVNNGSVRRVGGLAKVDEGLGFYENSYLTASTVAFQTAVQGDRNNGYSQAQAAVKNAGLLQKANIGPIQPERINSFEAGYKSILFNNKLVVDLDGYFNFYDGFIGQLEVATPNSGKIGENQNTVFDALSNSSLTRYRVQTNAKDRVYNYGSALGLTYNFYKKYTLSGNLNYNAFDKKDSKDPLIPGFNTPKYFTNVSFGNREVVKNFGFNVTWRWQDRFLWQNLFGDGYVPAYYTVDAQVNYRMPKLHSTFKLGGSNIFNKRYIQYIGGPSIGALYYLSITVDGLLSK